MNSRVLDASALLALLAREPGWETVQAALRHQAHVSAVNWAEVVGKLSDIGMAANDIREVLQLLPVAIVPADAELAVQVGLLRTSTRQLGLSLADRACLALAARLGVPALTADRVWTGLELGIQVEMIR